MGWVKEAMKALEKGENVQIRPQGGSMRGRIESGQEVTLEPVKENSIQINDVVLVQWKGNFLLHLVLEIHNEQVLIGNNLRKQNGWVSAQAIKGRVVGVSD